MTQQADISNLQYPIGKFVWADHETVEPGLLRECINEIAQLPTKLRRVVLRMNEKQLDTPYRPGGWTARQVVHHLADSHINAYVRFKLTLTEDMPTIKPYKESLWAEHDDGKTMDVTPSIEIIDGMHMRLAALLRSMSDADFTRRYYHPEYQKEFHLAQVAALYAWHGKHHVEHIKIAAGNL